MTVQKICRVCRDEKNVRSVLHEVQENPSKAEQLLTETLIRNRRVFEFEKTFANARTL